MNAKRIFLGGVVAALIIAAVETLLFGFILAEPMARATAEKGLTEASWKASLELGTTLVPGLILAWLYAAIRPRFGPGPRTALKAGAMLWIATWLMFYLWLAPTGRGLLFMKPLQTAIAMLGELAGVLLAALAAGWIYREDGHV